MKNRKLTTGLALAILLLCSTVQAQTSSTIPGRFPEASERLLTASDLRDLNKEDLKIMRNEIFARHGYIFKTAEMKQYFQKQSWYTPRYSDVNAKLSKTELKNIDLIKSYENKTTGSASKKGTAPPIENISGYQWANASIQLPKNWDGTFILANGFVWIDNQDTKLQKKYGVYPDTEYETWDNDDQYYKYPLAPNVAIYAGGYTDDGSWNGTKKMTISQFASYLRERGHTEGEDWGMITNVTYSNGTITKIEERYTP